MNPTPDGACSATTSAGKPCRAHAVPGGRFCFFHDPHPDTAEVRSQARRQGGRERSRPRAAPPDDAAELDVRDVDGVYSLLSDTINKVRKGRLDTRIANTVGYLASVLLRAFEVGELEERLAHLEAAVRPAPGAGEAESAFDHDIHPVHAGARP